MNESSDKGRTNTYVMMIICKNVHASAICQPQKDFYFIFAFSYCTKEKFFFIQLLFSSFITMIAIIAHTRGISLHIVKCLILTCCECFKSDKVIIEDEKVSANKISLWKRIRVINKPEKGHWKIQILKRKLKAINFQVSIRWW